MRAVRHLFAALAIVVLIAGIGVAQVRGSHQAKLDDRLATQLDAADPGTLTMVFVHGSDIEVAKRAVKASDMQLVDTFDKVGVAVATGTPREIENVGTQPGVSFVEADQPIDFFMQTSHEATRGEEALRGFTNTNAPTSKKGKQNQANRPPRTLRSPGVDGSGVSIAVIDSGVDGTHPMFQQDGESKVLKNYKLVCASGVLIPLAGPCNGAQGDAIDETFIDMTDVGNDTDTPSMGGHGTHVAGIAAGVGVETQGTTIHGAAPGAKIISLSVGQVISVYGGSAGMNWVLEHHAAPCGEGVDPAVCPPIKVINNSWGSGGAFNPEDLRSKIQDALVAEGVTVAWAAGNAGGDGSADRVNPPAKSPTPGILSVANYDDGNLGTRDGGLATTSSRGQAGDTTTYPDISAPGSNIYSACRAYLAICNSGEEDLDYGTIGGTSMATPHIAGIVSQLIQASRQSLGRDLSPGEIEDTLEDTAYQFSFGASYEADVSLDADGNPVFRNSDHNTSFDKGHGLVDVVGAVSRIRGIQFQPGETVCVEGAPLAVDGAGDASDPTVDLLTADISSVDVQGTEGEPEVKVTFRFEVADLTGQYPFGTNGIWFDFDFTYGPGSFYVAASRRQVGGIPPTMNQETFTFGQQQGQQLVTLASGLSGEFNFETDEVLIHLTQADLDRADEAFTAGELPPLADGAAFTSLIANSRTQVSTPAGSLVTPDDSAVTGCDFVVTSSVQPPPPPPPPEPPEAEATLSATQPEYTWTGGPTTDAGVFFGCGGVSGSTCDETFLEVLVPEGGATLRIDISAGDDPLSGESDYDLYLYGPDGKEMKASENAGTNETIEVPVTVSGVYRIEVFAWLTVNAEYSGVARLQ